MRAELRSKERKLSIIFEVFLPQRKVVTTKSQSPVRSARTNGENLGDCEIASTDCNCNSGVVYFSSFLRRSESLQSNDSKSPTITSSKEPLANTLLETSSQKHPANTLKNTSKPARATHRQNTSSPPSTFSSCTYFLVATFPRFSLCSQKGTLLSSSPCPSSFCLHIS